jgi:hypothetical protein
MLAAAVLEATTAAGREQAGPVEAALAVPVAVHPLAMGPTALAVAAVAVPQTVELHHRGATAALVLS